MMIRDDIIDQAKFRVPRNNIKSHLTDSLFRPALHIQGVWCHGFGFHFAISDADAKKDTTTNVETVCRMIEAVFHKFRVLPRTLVLIMDNTSRENKNQIMVKIMAKLVLLRVFEHIWLAFPQGSHPWPFGCGLRASHCENGKQLLRRRCRGGRGAAEVLGPSQHGKRYM